MPKKEDESHMLYDKIVIEKKYVLDHPYCTNWPTKRKYEQLEFDFDIAKEDNVAPI